MKPKTLQRRMASGHGTVTSASSIPWTFSLKSKSNAEEGRFEQLASLKKLLQKELNRSITVDECDAALLAGSLLLNDANAVKEQTKTMSDLDIQLWGHSVDPLAKWISQNSLLSQAKNIHKFIEGNTR